MLVQSSQISIKNFSSPNWSSLSNNPINPFTSGLKWSVRLDPLGLDCSVPKRKGFPFCSIGFAKYP